MNADGAQSIIAFNLSMNDTGLRPYYGPWDSQMYETYQAVDPNANLIIVDCYSDGANLSQSGNQSATFLRVIFSNINTFSERWFTVGTELTSKLLLECITYDQRRKLNLNLMQRLNFTAFRRLTEASHSGTMIAGVLLIARISVVIDDQPEDRAIVCL